MALSDQIDADAFQTAHELAINNTPQWQRGSTFVTNLTRTLIRQLQRMGVEEVCGNSQTQETAEHKILGAFYAVQQEKSPEEWEKLVTNHTALRYALENALAARTSQSEMPHSIRRITQKLSSIPPANPPQKISK